MTLKEITNLNNQLIEKISHSIQHNPQYWQYIKKPLKALQFTKDKSIALYLTGSNDKYAHIKSPFNIEPTKEQSQTLAQIIKPIIYNTKENHNYTQDIQKLINEL